MTSQRMSALEAAFVELETRGAPFVYAAILELDRPIELAALRRHLDQTLASEPRYRQRMTRGPLGRHAWANDNGFRIERHVRAITAPPPGGPHQVEALAASMLGADLPRDHAPWQIWTVQGLAGGRGALIAVVHHALVDGLAGIRLLEQVFGIAEASGRPRTTRTRRRAARTRRRAALRRLVRPGVVAALARLLRRGLSPAAQLGINPRHTGRARGVASLSVPRPELERIQHALGASTNDVVLATVAGALRRFLARRGIDVDEARDVRAMVPVGRHADDPAATSGNRVALLLAPLPVDLADPAATLTRITTATHALKHGQDANAGDLLVAIADATSPRVLAGVLRLTLRMRAFNVVVTNIPGPTEPLSLLGANLVKIVPIVNLWPHHALDIAFATYGELATFGVHVDRAVVPEPDVFAADLADTFDALLDAVEPLGAPHHHRHTA